MFVNVQYLVVKGKAGYGLRFGETSNAVLISAHLHHQPSPTQMPVEAPFGVLASVFTGLLRWETFLSPATAGKISAHRHKPWSAGYRTCLNAFSSVGSFMHLALTLRLGWQCLSITTVLLVPLYSSFSSIHPGLWSGSRTADVRKAVRSTLSC